MDAKKVFICHSSRDSDTAQHLCQILEKMGLSCWIAPRNVTPGARFPSEIIKAIGKCAAFVLVFSSNSNASDHVINEVERAFSKKIRIFPFKIHDIQPSADLEYFISLPHWFSVSSAGIEADGRALGEAILSYIRMDTPAPPQELPREVKTTISPVIDAIWYPLALALNDIRELEFERHPDNTAARSHVQSIEDAAFKLIDGLVKFITIALLGWYQQLPEESWASEVERELPAILDPRMTGWLRLLKQLTLVLAKNENTPELVRLVGEYLQADYSALPSALRVAEVIGKNCRSVQPEDSTLYSWLCLMSGYENEYKNLGVRITNLGKPLKEAVVEVASAQELYQHLRLASVIAISPNKKTKNFDHRIMPWHGLEIAESPHPYATSGWSFIESTHAFLYSPDTQDLFFDLFPFMLTDDETGELLIWHKSADFHHITYKRIKDQEAKELYQPHPGKTIDKIRAMMLDAPEPAATGLVVSGEEIMAITANHEKFLRTEIRNPLLIEEISSRLSAIRQQIEAQASKDLTTNFVSLVPKLNKIKFDMTLGSYAKLAPTETDYILTDEHSGKYIIAEKLLQNKPELESSVKVAQKIFNKPLTLEVQVLIWMAVNEAHRYNGASGLGVEHLMIAISKLCNRFVFAWYDAIGVPPKYHRDLTRFMISQRAALHHVGKASSVKERLCKVFVMISEEIDLAKRDEVTVTDLLSGILREGGSLPLRVLHQLFNLTSDRILGEFYHLQRTI